MNCAFKKIEIFGVSVLLLVLPQIVFAAGITDLIDAAFGIVTGVLTPLAFSLCLLYFFWGVVKYIKTGAESDKSAEEGKKIMIWGIVGLFVASSVWGIITFIQSELGIPDVKAVTPTSGL